MKSVTNIFSQDEDEKKIKFKRRRELLISAKTRPTDNRFKENRPQNLMSASYSHRKSHDFQRVLKN